MANEKVCKKCFRCIDCLVELYTICEGDCACFFHADCVGLKEADFDVLSRPTNIIWMCDGCMMKYKKARDGIRPDPADATETTTTIEQEVRELKIAVTGILDTLSKVSPTVSPDGARHSTPIAYTLFDGTNGPDDATDYENLQRSSDTAIDDRFALFLSNIDPCATEVDVHRMVSHALGISRPECLDVIKLTKKWNNRRIVDFVSFKVIIDRKWKSKALEPSTWPIKIRFREFIDKQNDTWRPIL